MAKSKDKTEKKLPEKTGEKSTKAKTTSPAKRGGMPIKHSSPQESKTLTKSKNKKTLPAKENETPTKHSSPQARDMPKNPYVPSPKNGNNSSPKNHNNGDKAKEIHKILILCKADGTKFGWAFIGFYDIKEWLKSLCNRGQLNQFGYQNLPAVHKSIHSMDS